MPALIDTYQATRLEQPVPVTYTVQQVGKTDLPEGSTIFKFPESDHFDLNARALRLLEDFKTLRDNWDGDDARAPDAGAVRQAENLVHQLQRIGQRVYHVAPGPNGEVLVDLREKGKSAEILFYPAKKRYVLFPAEGHPKQGEYDASALKNILEWLYE